MNAQVNQVRRALFSMLNKSYNLSLPPDIQIKLFDQLVLPVLLYGCEIWAFRNTYQTEALHTKFCKSILKLSKYTPNCMVYGELGQHKMKTVELRIVSFWCVIACGRGHKLAHLVFKNYACY